MLPLPSTISVLLLSWKESEELSFLVCASGMIIPSLAGGERRETKDGGNLNGLAFSPQSAGSAEGNASFNLCFLGCPGLLAPVGLTLTQNSKHTQIRADCL